MLRETGRVVALEEGAVWVETIRSSACGRCAARAGCGHGALSGAVGGGRGLIRVRDGATWTAADCELHDSVEIELPESAVLVASATVYGLPLVCGAITSVMLSSYGEWAAMTGFGVGLAAGFAVARWIGGRAAPDAGFEPRLVRRVDATQSDLIATSVTT